MCGKASHKLIEELTECEIRIANKNVSLLKKENRLWQQSPAESLPSCQTSV